jgi:hypothetical protein
LISNEDFLAIAPDLAQNAYIWRPVLADPPVYTIAEFQRLTMLDVLCANQILDLRIELHRRAAEKANREAKRQARAKR